MKSEKERLIEALEKINFEKKTIMMSKDYKKAKNFTLIKSNLKRLDFVSLFKELHKITKEKIIKERRKKYEKNKADKNEEANTFGIYSGSKIVVYTCITGNYDNPLPPLFCADNTTYVLYSNSIKSAEGWITKKIPKEIQKLNNDILINRYIKTHPHELFLEYDYAIYIDGNIRSISDLSGFINKINRKVRNGNVQTSYKRLYL